MLWAFAGLLVLVVAGAVALLLAADAVADLFVDPKHYRGDDRWPKP